MSAYRCPRCGGSSFFCCDFSRFYDTGQHVRMSSATCRDCGHSSEWPIMRGPGQGRDDARRDRPGRSDERRAGAGTAGGGEARTGAAA